MPDKPYLPFLAVLLLTALFACKPPSDRRSGMVPEKILIEVDQASGLASPALHCIQKPYPYKPGNVLVDDSTVMPPRLQHPAFYGCFDWHSSVHGHWTLVKLLKEFPELPEGEEIRRKLSGNLTAENIAIETGFFYSEGNRTFERTYGWAWLLKLSLELETWDDPLGEQLARNLRPLADSLVRKYLAFLEVLPYPIRVGEHTNTAFGLSFAWDYAEEKGISELKDLIEARARDFYIGDQDCPLSWEPGGFDFLSPCLMEADLMARVLGEEEYRSWLNSCIPGILNADFSLDPANVADRTDPKIVHLDGLNFSRAWCLFHIASKLGGIDRAGGEGPAVGEGHAGDSDNPANVHDSKEVDNLRELAYHHLEASLPYIATGNYEGEHWLASFAVFALFSQ